MASTHHFFLGLTLLFALSFSALEMAFGARSLATMANSNNNQAELSKKQITLPSNKMEIPGAEKQPTTLPKDNPKADQNGVKQSLYPSLPGTGFTFPGNFNLPPNLNIPRNFNFPPLTPYLSSPSLPWPDLPLVPAIPFTPPTLPVPISDQTPSDGSDQEAAKVQSP